jgi:very-short-patch-repair endonuclease
MACRGRGSKGRFRSGVDCKPDCMWPEQRLLAELDGGAVHRTETGFESDRQRDRILLVEGWRSTRITWRQLRVERDEIAADLRELLKG